MRRQLLSVVFACTLVLALHPGWAPADIPSLQLDGTYSKQSPHRDAYPYAPLDHAAADANPLRLGVKRTLAKGTPEAAEIEARLEKYPWAEQREVVAKAYGTEVRKEFPLSEKEKEVVAKNPWEFDDENLKKGIRVAVSRILRLGGKDYPFGDCNGIGDGDLNGDGVKEVMVCWVEPVTHAGGSYEYRLFDTKGNFLWYASGSHGGMGDDIGGGILCDCDQDGRDELILRHGNVYVVLGCPKEGESLPAFTGGRRDREPVGQSENPSRKAPPPPTPTPDAIPEDAASEEPGAGLD